MARPWHDAKLVLMPKDGYSHRFVWLWLVAIAFAAIVVATSSAARAQQEEEFWRQGPPIVAVEDLRGGFNKIVIEEKDLPLGFQVTKESVYVVARKSKPREGRGPIIVGRSVLAKADNGNLILVFYLPMEEGKPLVGDRLYSSGFPITDAERNLINQALASLPQVDRELDDLYHGLMSFKYGYYSSKLATTTSTDSNSYKQSKFTQMTYGFRWWFDFFPQLGVSYDYARGTIPIKGFHKEDETGAQTNSSLGISYRARFLTLPWIISFKYVATDFETSNPDDFVLGSSYSGLNVNMTFHELWQFKVFDTRFASFEMTNLEIGAGVFPFMMVSDMGVSRGQGTGMGFQANGGLDFHIGKIKLLKDFFFAFEGGWQLINVGFSGQTSNTYVAPNNQSTETQYWFGLRLKFHIKDYIGEMIKES